MDLGLISGCIGVVLGLISLGIGLYIYSGMKNILRASNSLAQIAGDKSGEVRSAKNLEKAVAGDILAKYPELTMLLEQLSPETAELIKKNPQLAVTLIQRYQPIIEKYLPMITGQGEKASKTEYDL